MGEEVEHCCESIRGSLGSRAGWAKIQHTPADSGGRGEDYSFYDRGRSGSSMNFCPFCGSVLPGAFLTNWSLHEKCKACHSSCDGMSKDNALKCICSKGYEELKEMQDSLIAMWLEQK